MLMIGVGVALSVSIAMCLVGLHYIRHFYSIPDYVVCYSWRSYVKDVWDKMFCDVVILSIVCWFLICGSYKAFH